MPHSVLWRLAAGSYSWNLPFWEGGEENSSLLVEVAWMDCTALILVALKPGALGGVTDHMHVGRYDTAVCVDLLASRVRSLNLPNGTDQQQFYCRCSNQSKLRTDVFLHACMLRSMNQIHSLKVLADMHVRSITMM